MDKQIYGFIVPFVTKGFLKKDNENVLKIEGHAYYLYNPITLKIYYQFIQIKSANFRPTDYEMLHSNKNKKRTTSYYQRDIIKIRKTILEPYQKKLKIYPENIHKQSKYKIEVPHYLIPQINKELLNVHRVKSAIDIFSGSNSSGAETNKNATNIVIGCKKFNKELFNSNYWRCSFSNPFNRSEIFFHDLNFKIKNISDIKLINFDEYLKLNKKAYDLFEIYNVSQLSINNKNFVNPISTVININKNNLKIYQESKIKKTSSPDLWWDKVNGVINDYQKYELNFDKVLENKLRQIQCSLIELEIQDLWEKYPIKPKEYFLNSLNSNFPSCEKAHIIPVYLCKKNINNWNKIADNNNCLLLEPNNHKLFDNNIINFDENGLCYQNQILQENIYIKREWLSEKRKSYLKTHFYK